MLDAIFVDLAGIGEEFIGRYHGRGQLSSLQEKLLLGEKVYSQAHKHNADDGNDDPGDFHRVS